MKRALLAASLCLLPAPARALFSGSDSGAAGARFLNLAPDARSAALGGAGGAAPADAAAMTLNPAALAALGEGSLSFSHAEHLGLFRHESLGFARPLRSGAALGASLALLTQRALARYDNTGVEAGGSFSPSDLAFGAGYARTADGWSWGGALKLIRQSIDDESAAGPALDLGVLTRLGPAMAGASLLNLGPELRMRSVSYPLPTALRLAGAWRARTDSLLAADLVWPRDGAPSLRLGAEWRPGGKDARAVLRAGFRTDRAAELGALAGFGVGLGLRLGAGVAADFAFTPFGALGESYRFGLSWRFAGAGSPGGLARRP